jgi:O-antigen/teichoic acid export membrane protein
MTLSNVVRKLSNNSFWLIIEKVTKVVLNFVGNVIVIRYLGTDDFGKIAYILALLIPLQALSVFGLDSVVVRFLREKHFLFNKKEFLSNNNEILKIENGHESNIITTTFAIRLLLGIFSYFILITILFIKDDNNLITIGSLIGFILIFQCMDVIDLILQSKFLNKYNSIARITGYVLSLLLKIAFIYLLVDVIFFALLYAIEAMIIALIFIIIKKKFSYNINYNFFDSSYARMLIKQSLPIMFSGVLVGLSSRMDLYLISSVLGSEKIGVYSAIVMMTTGFYFLAGVICTVALPFLSDVYASSLKLYVKYKKYLGLFLLLISSVIYLFMYLSSGFIVNNLLELKYSDAEEVLKLYSLCIITVFFGVYNGMLSVIEKSTINIFFRGIASIIIAYIFCSLFIPPYGLQGAAISAVLTSFAADILIPFILSRKKLN